MTEIQAGYELPQSVRSGAAYGPGAGLTARQCVAMVAAFDRLTEQVRRVRRLHRTVTVEVGLPPSALPRCAVCKVTAPCDTVAVLGPDVTS